MIVLGEMSGSSTAADYGGGVYSGAAWLSDQLARCCLAVVDGRGECREEGKGVCAGDDIDCRRRRTRQAPFACMLPLRDSTNATLTVFTSSFGRRSPRCGCCSRWKREGKERGKASCHTTRKGPPASLSGALARRVVGAVRGEGVWEGSVHRGGEDGISFDFWVTEREQHTAIRLLPLDVPGASLRICVATPGSPARRASHPFYVSAPWLLHGRCSRL